ncbi:hypothetical protein QA089_004707 [Meyerozyma guilliermondii]
MARIGSQAMILTAPYRNDSQSTSKNPTLHGMTLSSVCSLSVSPTPLLSFNLHLPSYTSKSLHERDSSMAIHLMPPTANAVKLGRIFASGVKKKTGTDEISFQKNEKEQKDCEVFHEMTTPFKYVAKDDWFEYQLDSKVNIPILREAERVFICKKRQVVEVDSHEIWAVEVHDILNPNPSTQATGGLLYYNRAFHSVGKCLHE